MAIFRPSPLVTGISGAAGGVEFARVRGSNVVRKRQHKLHVRTDAQYKQLANVQRVQSRWNELSDDDRLLWETIASITPISNRIGQRRTLAAYHLYMLVCATPLNAPVSIAQPATTFAAPPALGFITYADITGVYVEATTGTFDASVNGMWYAWRYSRTTLRRQPPQLRYITGRTIPGTGSAENLDPEFAEKLGQLASGETYTVAVRAQRQAGLPSALSYATGVYT